MMADFPAASVAAEEAITDVAVGIKPTQATLVPEKREEVTTEGGLDVVVNLARVQTCVEKLHAAVKDKNFHWFNRYRVTANQYELAKRYGFDVSKVICDPGKPLLEGALGVGATATSMLEQISQAGARLGLDLLAVRQQLHRLRHRPRCLEHAYLPGAGSRGEVTRRSSTRRRTRATARYPAGVVYNVSTWLTRSLNSSRSLRIRSRRGISSPTSVPVVRASGSSTNKASMAMLVAPVGSQAAIASGPMPQPSRTIAAPVWASYPAAIMTVITRA